MKNGYKIAFTLVELIVVITILAILATVAFISFQGYTSSSRDSVRLSDLKNITKAFEINRTKGILFPLPANKVDISSSGTIFQYQGEISQEILNKEFNIFNGGVDPETLDPYGYVVNLEKNKFQLVGFMENPESVAHIQINNSFADNSDKYVKTAGDTLGILLDETTHDIVTQSGSLYEIDIENNTENYSFFGYKKIHRVPFEKLRYQFDFQKNTNSSCKSLQYNGKYTTNGIYNINPSGGVGTDFNVYCDMRLDGGGWTLIFNSYGDESYDKIFPGTDYSDPNTYGISFAYSKLPLGADILLEFSTDKIDQNNINKVRKDIFYNVDFQGNIFSEMVNQGNDIYYFFNNFTQYKNIGNNNLFSSDYGNIGVNYKELVINDGNFMIGLYPHYNAAGWPDYNNYLMPQYNSHWGKNVRIWTR